MSNKAEEYKDYHDKEEFMSRIESECPDNNENKISAWNLRNIFKSIIETFWKPKTFIIDQNNINKHISNSNSFYNTHDNEYEGWGYGHLHIPYCDVLYIKHNLIWPRLDYGVFGYILMDNVENGHTLKIMGDFRPGALTHCSQANVPTSYWKYNKDDEFFMETVGNISRQVYAKSQRPWSYENIPEGSEEEKEYRRQILTDGPEVKMDGSKNQYIYSKYYYIELMYWNGVWYECAY